VCSLQNDLLLLAPGRLVHGRPRILRDSRPRTNRPLIALRPHVPPGCDRPADVRTCVGRCCDNVDVRVFISSLITGYESLRNAAATAIATLDDQPVRAEDFPASSTSPQQACLAGVRASDAVVLILGDSYGVVQQSGLSATHEEYREARESRPVLVFIQQDLQADPRQLEFVHEVQGWERGHYTAQFTDADDLRNLVTRALHEFALANEAAPLNDAELVGRARALIPEQHYTNRAAVLVAVAPGPARAVVRPAELEGERLRRFLLAEALTGDFAVLTPASGTDETVQHDTIQLHQRQVERLITLNEGGCVAVTQPAVEDDGWRTGIPAIIEENVVEVIERSLRFVTRILDYIDPPGRLTHIAPLVAVVGAGYLPWRTRGQQEHSPNAATIGIGGSGNVVVALTPPVRRRPALIHDNATLAQDFAARLRRELRR
jgi:Domain of unknown function (DUF4062)